MGTHFVDHKASESLSGEKGRMIEGCEASDECVKEAVTIPGGRLDQLLGGEVIGADKPRIRAEEGGDGVQEGGGRAGASADIGCGESCCGGGGGRRLSVRARWRAIKLCLKREVAEEMSRVGSGGVGLGGGGQHEVTGASGAMWGWAGGGDGAGARAAQNIVCSSEEIKGGKAWGTVGRRCHCGLGRADEAGV